MGSLVAQRSVALDPILSSESRRQRPGPTCRALVITAVDLLTEDEEEEEQQSIHPQLHPPSGEL